MMNNLMKATVVVLITISIGFVESIPTMRRGSISCFSCSSRNRTHESCHDPMHPANTSYITNCKVPQENHIGVFPALFCVKVINPLYLIFTYWINYWISTQVIGVTEKTEEELIIRTCSIENMDNQCGTFKFEDEMVRGCILTCNYDGCNSGNRIGFGMLGILIPLLGFYKRSIN